MTKEADAILYRLDLLAHLQTLVDVQDLLEKVDYTDTVTADDVDDAMTRLGHVQAHLVQALEACKSPRQGTI